MHHVVNAKYVNEYKILLTFNDQKRKVVDFDKLLNHFEGPIFQPLKNIEYFKKFKISLDTITWPNEADVCPDTLYDAE